MKSGPRKVRNGARLAGSGLANCIIGAFFLMATVLFLLYAPKAEIPSAWIPALLSSLVLGVWFLGFAPAKRWTSPLVFLVFIGGWFWLSAAPALAWFGGFVAGTNFGAGLRSRKTGRRSANPPEWAVDGRAFSGTDAAREAALAALRMLDTPGSNGRLTVLYESAGFEAAGGGGIGFVCHRSSNTADDGAWAVLSRDQPNAAPSIEVSMGNAKAFMPLRLVHDLGAAEAALTEFFASPVLTSYGPAWVTGPEAEATRLNTRR
ncbi:hypothetical protein BN1051_01229 [Arthrobacter saudimassiliensis]|uniref:Uncharacterized protein n=1 Tax=Arthrobacter saudimassiliensis TaxID=1461584 RepID=A0A078MKR4_9MICC|nr:hypothetical protein BN1051_01229 [Arthrobacter saudimassiliensis]